MLTKKWRSDLKSSIFSKSQDLISRWEAAFSVDQKQEFEQLQSQLSSLTPSAQISLKTLVANSKLQRQIQLPERDQLLAEITAYSYLPPEKRPYQVWNFYLEPAYNSIFHCIYLNHQEKVCIIAYRGTDFKNKSDLISDAQIILWVNAIDPRVTGSLTLFDQLRKTHVNYQKWICGN